VSPGGGPSKDFIREVFGSIVARYDLANDVITLGLHRLWRRKAVRLLEQRSDRLLDLGAGTGSLTKLAGEGGFAGQAVLCDLLPEMLKASRMNLNGAGAAFVCGDGEFLPFRGTSFDRAILGFSLRNMPDVPAALRELCRVLAPGGRVVVLETSKPTPFGRPFVRFYMARLVPLLGAWVTRERRSYEHLRDSSLAFPDQSSLKAMMLAAGFNKVKFYNLLGGVAAIHIGEKA
jgi:demethylmenaquinone methyltransferase/2-methoxy-6-polyprenyl-1,4-benzoquinol methylase